MNMRNWIGAVIKYFYSLTEVIVWLGYITLTGIVVIVFIDVCGRYFFNSPFLGAYESVEVGMTILVGSAVMWATFTWRHVSIDILISRFNRRIFIILQSMFSFLGFVAWIGVAYLIYLFALDILRTGQMPGLLPVSRGPFLIVLSVALFFSSLISLIQTFHHGVSEQDRGKRGTWAMSNELMGVMVIGIMLFLMFLGMPIWLSMLLPGTIFIALLSGVDQAFSVVAITINSIARDYDFAVLPVFLLLGEFAEMSGMMTAVYNSLNTLVGKIRGGLAMASVLGAAAFSCISGSSMACAAIMTRVALPKLLDYKYDPKLATGALCAGGTLGNLIPPGTILVIYAILAQISLGKLFIACYIPGFLLAFMYLLQIYIQCVLNPSLGPSRASGSTWREKLVATKYLMPVVIALVVILGGLELGVFTPNEAASICTILTFLYAIARKTVSGQKLKLAFSNTLATTGMIFAIIMCARVFTVFLALSQLPQALGTLLTELNLSALGLVILIMVVYFILGIPMNVIGMLVLTLPILLPLFEIYNIDLIWFGVLAIVQVELANITPPVGTTLFIVAGMVKPMGISMGTVFKGVIPFCITCILFLIILIAFPQISLFMVSQMQ